MKKLSTQLLLLVAPTLAHAWSAYPKASVSKDIRHVQSERACIKHRIHFQNAAGG